MSSLDVADEMEYDEKLALFRQTRLNPFDRGEEEDGPQGGKMPPQHGKVSQSSSQEIHDTAVSSLECVLTLRSLKIESVPCTLLRVLLRVYCISRYLTACCLS